MVKKYTLKYSPLSVSLLTCSPELMRLMGTATDGGRKAIIQDSLKSLESPERTLGKKIGQVTPNAYETEKVMPPSPLFSAIDE
jgi:hypothetical protein